jgi:hypothetical protein
MSSLVGEPYRGNIGEPYKPYRGNIGEPYKPFKPAPSGNADDC